MWEDPTPAAVCVSVSRVTVSASGGDRPLRTPFWSSYRTWPWIFPTAYLGNYAADHKRENRQNSHVIIERLKPMIKILVPDDRKHPLRDGVVTKVDQNLLIENHQSQSTLVKVR